MEAMLVASVRGRVTVDESISLCTEVKFAKRVTSDHVESIDIADPEGVSLIFELFTSSFSCCLHAGVSL